METALDAGADDVITDGEMFEVTTAPGRLENVREALVARGIAITNAELTRHASLHVPVEGKEAETLLKLVEAIEDHDDVQKVYANFSISDEVMARLAK